LEESATSADQIYTTALLALDADPALAPLQTKLVPALRSHRDHLYVLAKASRP
jgi:hypothetical protein